MSIITTKQILVPQTEITIQDDKKTVVLILEKINDEILMEGKTISISWERDTQDYRNFKNKMKELGLDDIGSLTREMQQQRAEWADKMLPDSDVTLEYLTKKRCQEAFDLLLELIDGAQEITSLGSFEF